MSLKQRSVRRVLMAGVVVLVVASFLPIWTLRCFSDHEFKIEHHSIWSNLIKANDDGFDGSAKSDPTDIILVIGVFLIGCIIKAGIISIGRPNRSTHC